VSKVSKVETKANQKESKMKYSTPIMRAEFLKTFKNHESALLKFNLDTIVKTTKPMFDNDADEEGLMITVYSHWFGKVDLVLAFDGEAWYLNVNATARQGFSNSDQFKDSVHALKMISGLANAIQIDIDNSR
jgi:uncharacterized protein YbcC (UPF0753/DUF2309 family)